jgi:Fe-S cluster assembly protein SufD
MLDQAVEQKQAPYLSAFARLEAKLAGIGPRWLHDTRRVAIDSFAELGFPATRNEEWKFTNVAAIAGIPFPLASRGGDLAVAEELIRDLPGGGNRLVFVNGYYAPELSRQLERRAIIGNLREALEEGKPELDRHLCRYAGYRTHPFIALNTAFLVDGALVHVPAGTFVESPIHLVHISTGGPSPQASYPRNLIVLEEGAQASVIETYIGRGASVHEHPYLTNVVTEIVGGQESVLDHYRLQMESDGGFHIATVQMAQGRGCAFRSHSLTFGAALARTEVNAVLSEGSDCTLNGLYVAGGNQHVDSRTSIDHAQPHGTSHELYKGILDGRSSAVFNGKIIVRKDAQKTDAKQTNKNLVLSEDSTINTKPELQILADDVRCTHGATIGQIDNDALFYLQSRGVGQEQAREMLIAAFAGEIIEGIRVEPLRGYVESTLAVRLARNAK